MKSSETSSAVHIGLCPILTFINAGIRTQGIIPPSFSLKGEKLYSPENVLHLHSLRIERQLARKVLSNENECLFVFRSSFSRTDTSQDLSSLIVCFLENSSGL